MQFNQLHLPKFWLVLESALAQGHKLYVPLLDVQHLKQLQHKHVELTQCMRQNHPRHSIQSIVSWFAHLACNPKVAGRVWVQPPSGPPVVVYPYRESTGFRISSVIFTVAGFNYLEVPIMGILNGTYTPKNTKMYLLQTKSRSSEVIVQIKRSTALISPECNYPPNTANVLNMTYIFWLCAKFSTQLIYYW